MLGMSAALTGPSVDEHLDETTDHRLDEGDHDRFAHYVRKQDILDSAVNGTQVTALCGKRWIPNRDPERFPVCPECKAIHAALFGGGR
jgi:hypothetical protein